MITYRAVTISCLLVATVPVAAQQAAYVPLAAQLPVGVRSLGMGGPWAPTRDAGTVFVNPANAGTTNSMSLGASRFGSAGTLAYAATSSSFGSRGLAIGVAWLDYGTSESARPTWEALGVRGANDGLSAMAVAAGSLTFKGIRWGAAAKLLQERIANSHDATPAFDVGATKDVGPVSAGLTIQNVGASLELGGATTPLPMRYVLGATTQTTDLGPFDVSAAASLSVRRDGFTSAGGGIDVSYLVLEGYTIAFRAGAQRAEALSVNPFTVGATLAMDRFSLDYAYQDLKAPLRGSVHSVGIRVR
ncbi:MAG: hypothetical protein U0132_10060 [Gemmatimonadaceae bacterium]